MPWSGEWKIEWCFFRVYLIFPNTLKAFWTGALRWKNDHSSGYNKRRYNEESLKYKPLLDRKIRRHFKRRVFSGLLDYAEVLLTIFALRVKILIGMLSADWMCSIYNIVYNEQQQRQYCGQFHQWKFSSLLLIASSGKWNHLGQHHLTNFNANWLVCIAHYFLSSKNKRLESLNSRIN